MRGRARSDNDVVGDVCIHRYFRFHDASSKSIERPLLHLALVRNMGFLTKIDFRLGALLCHCTCDKTALGSHAKDGYMLLDAASLTRQAYW